MQSANILLLRNNFQQIVFVKQSVIFLRGRDMFLFLFILWIIFNGNLTLEIALFGIGVAGGVFLFACKFMGYSVKKDIFIMKKLPYFVLYVLALIWEIIKANIATIKLVLSRRYDVEPVLVKFDIHFDTNMGKVLFANSITLTPGTITVDVKDDTYTVHGLDNSFVDGIDEGRIVNIIRRLEETHA